MGKPYSGGVAAGGTVMWASVAGVVCGGVAEGGVGDALGVGVGDARSVVGDAPVDSPCSVCKGAAGGGMVGVALVITSVWVLSVVVRAWVVVGLGPRHSSRRAWWVFVVGWFAGLGGVGRLWCLGMPSPIMAGGGGRYCRWW